MTHPFAKVVDFRQKWHDFLTFGENGGGSYKESYKNASYFKSTGRCLLFGEKYSGYGSAISQSSRFTFCTPS